MVRRTELLLCVGMSVLECSFFFTEPIDVLWSRRKVPIGAGKLVDLVVKIVKMGGCWGWNGSVPGGVGHGELARQQPPISIT